MRTNTKKATVKARTHEGAPSPVLRPVQELRRTVMANMLFEDTFYESGEDVATRLRHLCSVVPFGDLAQIAVDAREKFKLRHVPLLLLREALRHHKGRQVGDLISRVIQRPDELGELLALYRKDGGKSEPAQLKIGLARALKKFNKYQLAKYNRDGDFKLRDVLFLCHARPKDEAQAALFKKLAEGKLETPDTWEVALSEGADKGETFKRLILDNELGALALLRNLRNMIQAQVPEKVIRQGLTHMRTERVLPFRFISAAKYAPRLEDALEQAMFRCLQEQPRLKGHTAILVDHSGSMNGAKVSKCSEIDRFEAAAALAMILRETAEHARTFAFSDHCMEVAPRRGFGLLEQLRNCMPFGSTYLGEAVRYVYRVYPECERLIVITDEQSADRPAHPQGKGYIVNVGTYQQGIAYGPWVAIDGWSEAVLDFIRALEDEESNAG